MVVGEIAQEHDLVVVGAGPGGYSAALHAARLGREVTLVDAKGDEGIGGTCLLVGCIPSKALIQVAQVVSDVDRLASLGITPSGIEIDLAEFQLERNRLVSTLTDGVRTLLHQAGVRIVEGWFRFQREGYAMVTPSAGPVQYLAYSSVVLAPGSRPTKLAQLPFDHETVLDSTDVLEMDEVPEELIVVGGGYVGLELGTALAKLGSQVTIVEAMDRLLPTMPPSVGRAVEARLGELGVTVYTNTRAEGIDGGELRTSGGQDLSLSAPRVLVAIGRQPNTDDIGLGSLGLRPDNTGLLQVGPDRLLTRDVAAIGDVTPGPALAHKAIAEAFVAVDSLSGRPAAFDPAAIPTVVFSDPEVAVAGWSENEAREAGIAVDISTFPVTASGRGQSLGVNSGHGRWVIDRESNAVIGVEIIAPHASEFVAEGVLAIEMSALAEDIAQTIHPHPTMSEILGESAGIAIGRPIHVHSQAVRQSASDDRGQSG